jgi:two-component system, chemotaxis family, sensor kinase CheA
LSDELLRRLLAAFKAEQREHVDKIRGLLDELARSGEGDGPALQEAFRRAHSLKGAARAVDLRPVESLANGVETLFARVRDGRLGIVPETLKTLHRVLDSIEDWVAAYFQGQPGADPHETLAAVETLLGRPPSPPERTESPPPAAAPERPRAEADDALKVSARSLEQLMLASRRLFSAVSRQDAVTRQLAQVESLVEGLDAERARLRRTGTRALERLAHLPELAPLAAHFDSVGDRVRSLKTTVRDLRRKHATGAWGLKQAGADLQDQILGARMVPAESVFQGFRKMVRDLARDEGKEIDLVAVGLGAQADRLVLQALHDPLMHVLRNSISHGIEPPAERARRGKPSAGKLSLTLKTSGSALLVTLTDDGRGIAWEAVVEHAVKRQLLAQDEAAAASREDLSRLLFLPGFSTSRMVTDLSGRGMGLSVVAEAVKHLQGRVALRADEGAGTTLEITAPISIATHRLLVVEAAGQRFALPTRAVARLRRVPVGQIQTLAGHSVIADAGRHVPLAGLPGLVGLGDSALQLADDFLPVVVLKSHAGGVGLAVDAFVADMEAVVKGLRGGAERARHFGGAVAADDGTLLLVLDPDEILERFRAARGGTVLKTEKAAPARRALRILVADDSVTTRTLEKSILEAHGYHVILAVDGEEALQKLRAEPVDLAIVDIQMPRMDGFQLIEQVKKEPRLAKLPLIIVTSLESRDERERGLSLGADAYIVKRKFDHKGLLDTIRQIV